MAKPEMTILGGTQETSPTRNESTQPQRGLTIKRYYTKAGVHPFDGIDWEFRTAAITNEKGETIFEQKEVEVPKF